jgi:hypothetical protein
MKYTNKTGLPEAIAKAIENDPYNAGSSDITVTGLIAPPRQRALMKHHEGELVEDVSDCIYRLIGKSVHSILETAGASDLAEERLYIERAGWKIGGQFDSLTIESGILRDYKVTTIYSLKEGHKPEWEQQLNLLRLICKENWLVVKQLQIVTILRDWSKMEAKRNSDCPQTQVVMVDIPMWDDKQVEAWLMGRIKAHQDARNGSLPLCTDEDRWKTADKWAVVKIGGKRAKKLHMSEAEAASDAADSGAEYTVEFRKGEAKRCGSYCSAAPWCEQYQNEIKGA